MDEKLVISRFGQEEVRTSSSTMESAGVSEDEYHKLTTRYNIYNSFKVALPSNPSDQVLKPELLPAGTLVKEFTKKKNHFEPSRVFSRKD